MCGRRIRDEGLALGTLATTLGTDGTDGTDGTEGTEGVVPLAGTDGTGTVPAPDPVHEALVSAAALTSEE
jgi:hypothetical protein